MRSVIRTLAFFAVLLFPQILANNNVHIVCSGTSCTTGSGVITAYSAGNALYISVQWTDISVTITSMTDTGGDSFTGIAQQCMGPSFCSQAFYACNIHASATPQITVNFSGTGSAGGHLSSTEWSGATPSSGSGCVNATTSVQNLNIGPANTDFTITTLTTTVPVTTIINNASCDGCGVPSSGWSDLGIDVNNTYLYQHETTTGTYNIVVRNQFANSNVSAVVVAFIGAVQPVGARHSFVF